MASSSSTAPKLRASRKNEKKALARVARGSFQLGEQARWERYYEEHPHRRLADTRVATIGGTIAGHATALRLQMSLCGADRPLAGIAAVVVLPEFRRRGVAEALMHDVLHHIRRRKVALSMLYAFRESFYRKFGYGEVEAGDHLRVAPGQLPASPERTNVRRATARDLPAIRALYERKRAGTTGQLKRTAWWWKMRVLSRAPEQLVHVDPGTGKVDGYLLFEVPDQPSFPHQLCRVVELRAERPAAHRGLLGALEALGEQYTAVELVLPPGDALLVSRHRGIVGQPAGLGPMSPAGFVGGGAMLRLVRLADALAEHPAPALNGVRGRVGLRIEDPVFEDQCGDFDLTFGPEGARLARGRRVKERLHLSIDCLAQIHAGQGAARRLLAMGLIEGSKGSEKAADLLDAAFRGPPLYLGPANAF
ncbi:MAG: GNAT family N-acetyltransferase [Deltaproteobacteria bacterium]|nr:GNAT family N-acetyltransferase [Deltaproteobacteria bacterium]